MTDNHIKAMRLADTTTATKAGGAVLQVVAWRHLVESHGWMHTGGDEEAGAKVIRAMGGMVTKAEALTPHAPAQATIDELQLRLDNMAASGNLACEIAQSAIAERDALKAKQIDVEAVMRLADEWVVEAIHAALAANTGHTTLADPDAAREALRAFLLGDAIDAAMKA